MCLMSTPRATKHTPLSFITRNSFFPCHTVAGDLEHPADSAEGNALPQPFHEAAQFA